MSEPATLVRPSAALSQTPFRLEELGAVRENEVGGASAVLSDVNLTLAPGEWLNIVGANGSGKSTLGAILAGLGFAGRLSAAVWDRGFAGELPAPCVLQQPDAQLFGSTPREEIVFALEWLGMDGAGIAGAAESVLEEAGLLAVADMPWSELSGGQRQLAAVAAACAGRAPLLVLDEVTSMLDGDTRARVLGLIAARHREGAAVVWITQRLSELEHGRRVVALAGGKLVYDGPGESFLYGAAGPAGEPPCVACGLRLPFRAELAYAMRTRGGDVVAVRESSAASEQRTTAAVHMPLSIGGLRLIHGAGPATLGGETLELRPGRIVLLLGANGAGKTRLLETAAGLMRGERVSVRYGDLRLAGGKRRSAPDAGALLAYSYAAQSPEDQLFARTLEAELAYVLRSYGLSDADRAAAFERGLSAVGWDADWLRRDPYAMSGGERRRAALACALAAPAPWLLLDEPTSGLDAAGYERLADCLIAERRAGRGVLLVSHEPDWALPLADELLLLGPDGVIRHCTREALLDHPGWWREAGLPVPELYAALRRTRQLGALPEKAWRVADIAACLAAEPGAAQPEPAGEDARPESVGVDVRPELSETDEQPESARRTGPWDVEAGAKAAAAAADTLVAEDRLHSAADIRRFADEPARLSGSETAAATRHPAHKARPVPPTGSRLAIFDPRAVWLSYVLLSLAFFTSTGWAGLAASALCAVAVIAIGRLPLRQYERPLIAFAMFTLASAILSGLTGDSGGRAWWHMENSLATFASFAKTWLVLAIGIGLPAAVSPLRLRRALTQILPQRGAAGRRSQRVVLTVTLLLRFVPQLMAEWERYSRIALARGKDIRRSPAALLGRLRSTAIPFMLSLMRLGETVTLALESRGVGRREQPTMSERLRWSSRDTALLAAIAMLAAAVALIGRLG